MIDTTLLVDALVEMLWDIPERVAALGAADRVRAYSDRFPDWVSLPYAIHQMPTPSILVAWQGTQPGSITGIEVWKHQIGLFIRTGEGNPPTTYPALFRL